MGLKGVEPVDNHRRGFKWRTKWSSLQSRGPPATPHIVPQRVKICVALCYQLETVCNISESSIEIHNSTHVNEAGLFVYLLDYYYNVNHRVVCVRVYVCVCVCVCVFVCVGGGNVTFWSSKSLAFVWPPVSFWPWLALAECIRIPPKQCGSGRFHLVVGLLALLPLVAHLGLVAPVRRGFPVVITACPPLFSSKVPLPLKGFASWLRALLNGCCMWFQPTCLPLVWKRKHCEVPVLAWVLHLSKRTVFDVCSFFENIFNFTLFRRLEKYVKLNFATSDKPSVEAREY